MAPLAEKPVLPQALSTTFNQRLKGIPNTLYISSSLPSRSTKRNTQTINYAELDQDFDFDDNDNNGYDDAGNDNDNDYDEDDLGNGYGNNNNNNGNGNNNNNNEDTTVNLSNYQGKEASKAKPLTIFNAQQLQYNSSFAELMIPIKLNLDYQGNKISDLFLWNLNEKLITPELFTQIYCQELELTSQAISNEILKQINQQIETYSLIINTPLPLHLLPINERNELHVILDVSINLDNQLYEDKVEWDLLNNKLSPEEFAETVCKDLVLPKEFQMAIAVSIHESILKFKKELIENPQLIIFNNDDLSNSNMVYRSSFSTVQGVRYDLKNLGSKFQPNVEILTQWEIEKREIEKERNIRRLKRESMRIQDVQSNPNGLTSSIGEPGSKRSRYRRRYDELQGTWKQI